MSNQRNVLLAANWKQNQLWDECEAFKTQLKKLCPQYWEAGFEPEVELLICPAFPYIGIIGNLLDDAEIYIGGQDVSRFGGGAYTGDVSAKMLSDSGCDYCIVGHSERRNLFGDTDAEIAVKLGQLRAEEIVPILCVGESLEQREADEAVSFTTGQLDQQKVELGKLKAGEFVVAYEPIWAIGTGKSATEADAQEMASAIRKWLVAELGKQYAAETQILYGGSVKPGNISWYVSQPDIDGVLVGGASLNAASFAQLAKACGM